MTSPQPPRPEPGTFLRIPLADGSFAYGRVLAAPYVAFSTARTTAPSDDLDAIAETPLLFTQAVRMPWPERWASIGRRELDGEAAQPVVQFVQDAIDHRRCTIIDSEGRGRTATPEECIGLERAAVWEARHIEERLLDTFLNRPNAAEIQARVRLS